MRARVSQRAAVERHAQPRAQAAHEAQVGVGLGAAQAVVQVGRVQLEAQLGGEVAQGEQEGGRIGAAAHRDEQDGRPVRGAGYPRPARVRGAPRPRRARRRTGSTRRRRATGREGGGGAGTRTPDTEIMILLLYQLSYAAVRRGLPGGEAGRRR